MMSSNGGQDVVDININGGDLAFQAGQRVRLTGGVFAGLVGTVLASCSQGRVVILVASRPGGLRVEIDRPFVKLEEHSS